MLLEPTSTQLQLKMSQSILRSQRLKLNSFRAIESSSNASSRYYCTDLPRSWLRKLRQTIFGNHEPVAHPSKVLAEGLMPITDMMKTLFQITNDSIPMKYNKVFLAVPEFATMSNIFAEQIPLLLRQAGLEGFRGHRHWRQSQAVLLDLYGLDNCFGIPIDAYREIPDLECEKYNNRSIQSVLFVAVDGVSLTLRSLIREDGMFYPDLGETDQQWNNDKDDGYFERVDRALRGFVETQKIEFDLLLLSGTNATAPELQNILTKIFEDNSKIRPEEYLRTEVEHIFAAARGAAKVARGGMCDDFDACMPNPWCPISKHCRDWAWHGLDDDAKTEL